MRTNKELTKWLYLLTYLKLSEIRTGLLLNFNTAVLKNGIKRMVL